MASLDGSCACGTLCPRVENVLAQMYVLARPLMTFGPLLLSVVVALFFVPVPSCDLEFDSVYVYYEQFCFPVFW